MSWKVVVLYCRDSTPLKCTFFALLMSIGIWLKDPDTCVKNSFKKRLEMSLGLLFVLIGK